MFCPLYHFTPYRQPHILQNREWITKHVYAVCTLILYYYTFCANTLSELPISSFCPFFYFFHYSSCCLFMLYHLLSTSFENLSHLMKPVFIWLPPHTVLAHSEALKADQSQAEPLASFCFCGNTSYMQQHGHLPRGPSSSAASVTIRLPTVSHRFWCWNQYLTFILPDSFINNKLVS